MCNSISAPSGVFTAAPIGAVAQQDAATDVGDQAADGAATQQAADGAATIGEVPAAPEASPMLANGTTGEDVRRLQQMLNAAGAGLDEDGIFGPLTEAAVRSYQTSRGLEIDGVVGPQTKGALDRGDAPRAEPDPAPEPVEAPAITPAEAIAAPPPSDPSGQAYIWPVHASVSQEFGHDGHPGIDIAAGMGEPIVAARAGTVVVAGDGGTAEEGYGTVVVIDHGDGTFSRYAHQSDAVVAAGQQVEQGQHIGNVGSTGQSTGPHLHFEIRSGSPYGERLDPRELVGGGP